MKKYLWFGVAAVVALALIALLAKKPAPTETQPETPYVYTPSENPVAKGDRLLGIDITVDKSRDYGKSFETTVKTGTQFVQLSLPWNMIETKSGVYKNQFLAVADASYPKANQEVALSIPVIDTNNNVMPDFLKNKAFNDPVVVEHFKGLLDYVFAELSHTKLLSISIGNEVDSYLTNHPEQWDAYTDFYRQIVSYIKEKRPDLVVGVKATFTGLTRDNVEKMQKLNTSSDVILVTYYPLKDMFMVEDPNVIGGDFKRLTSLYSKPIYMLEAGYPSGVDNGSSWNKQADFMKEMFVQWDAYKDRIKAINFVWLHDLPDSEVKKYTGYYGLDVKSFASYLQTLGLRTYDTDTAKPAFTVLATEAKNRGW